MCRYSKEAKKPRSSGSRAVEGKGRKQRKALGGMTDTHAAHDRAAA